VAAAADVAWRPAALGDRPKPQLLPKSMQSVVNVWPMDCEFTVRKTRRLTPELRGPQSARLWFPLNE
jgi:hypothetical protein